MTEVIQRAFLYQKNWLKWCFSLWREEREWLWIQMRILDCIRNVNVNNVRKHTIVLPWKALSLSGISGRYSVEFRFSFNTRSGSEMSRIILFMSFLLKNSFKQINPKYHIDTVIQDIRNIIIIIINN